jgi:hypothetical protein
MGTQALKKLSDAHREYARRLIADPGDADWRIYKDVFKCKDAESSAVMRTAASLMRHDPLVAEYMEGLRKEVKERFMITVEGQIEKLEFVIGLATTGEKPQCAAAVQAIMAQAKLAGIDRQVEDEAPQPVQVIIQVQDASAVNQRDG